MARSEHICGNCEHHINKDGEWICTNRDSDLYGMETSYEDSCLDYEERENRPFPYMPRKSHDSSDIRDCWRFFR